MYVNTMCFFCVFEIAKRVNSMHFFMLAQVQAIHFAGRPQITEQTRNVASCVSVVCVYVCVFFRSSRCMQSHEMHCLKLLKG